MSFLIIVLVIMLYGSDLWPDLILTLKYTNIQMLGFGTLFFVCVFLVTLYNKVSLVNMN